MKRKYNQFGKVTQLQAMQIMFKNHNTKYLFLLGDLIIKGMDSKTAIWECWNRLEVKNG